MTHVLRLDGSMRHDGSTTRNLTDRVIERLSPDTVTVRDLTQGVGFVDADWIAANFTDPAERSAEQTARLAESDELIAELKAADTIVIGVPVYNFGVPAALKAWVDMIARARVTFRYSENGPVGLLEGKRAIIVAASGGMPLGSDIDFATPYLRHVLGFVGITNVDMVWADRQMANGETAMTRALQQVDDLAA